MDKVKCFKMEEGKCIVHERDKGKWK